MIDKSQVPEGCKIIAHNDNGFALMVGDIVRWPSYVRGESDLARRKLSDDDTLGERSVGVKCTILAMTDGGEFKILFEIHEIRGGDTRIV